MYEKLELCPSCKHMKFNNFIICKDHLVSEESFALVKCAKCQLVFVNPRPTVENAANYRSSNSISKQQKWFKSSIYKFHQKRLHKQLASTISQYATTGHLLSYGNLPSVLITRLEKIGWKISILTVDETELHRLVHANISVYSSINEIPKQINITAITAFTSLSQTYNLKKTIKSLKKVLAADGYLFVTQSSHNGYDAKHYAEHWSHYDTPRHLYHFNKDSFLRFTKTTKLNTIDIIPLPTQTHLTCMQSEGLQSKYKLLEAFRIGRKSNKLALEKRNEYSSQLYVLSK